MAAAAGAGWGSEQKIYTLYIFQYLFLEKLKSRKDNFVWVKKNNFSKLKPQCFDFIRLNTSILDSIFNMRYISSGLSVFCKETPFK